MANNLLYDLLGKLPFVQQLRSERGELAALRQLYDKDASVGLLPGHYYLLVDQGTGNAKGVSYVCRCSQEYRLLSLFECFRQGYRCPNCKDEINVLKHIGAIDASGTFKIKAQELEGLLMRLPVRPTSVGGSGAPRTIDTWGGDDSAIRWGGAGGDKGPYGSDGSWV